MSYSNSWIKVDKLLYTSISGSITGETGVGILVDLPAKNLWTKIFKNSGMNFPGFLGKTLEHSWKRLSTNIRRISFTIMLVEVTGASECSSISCSKLWRNSSKHIAGRFTASRIRREITLEIIFVKIL